MMAITKKILTQRSLNALDTKNTIFSTALHLFSQYGFDKVTVHDITKYAGVSKGTFYTHFESKESVLVEQFQKIDNHYDQVFKKVSPQESAGNRLLILIGALTDYCANVCGLAPLKVVYASQISPSVSMKILNNHNRSFYDLIRDIVSRGKASGEFHIDMEEDECVEFLARSSRALIYDWCLYNGEMDLEKEGQRYFKIILNYLNK